MPEASERLRVLIADDESATRMAARALFERRGHLVCEAADGAEAAAAAANADTPFDVLLLDLNMPVQGGAETLRAVRADPDPARAGPAVIMLTASSDPELERELLDDGADAVLTKPLRWDALAPVLAGCVAQAAGQEGRTPSLSPVERLLADLPRDKVRRLLDVAHDNLARHQADLNAAAACGDGVETARLAHKIAGVAGTYGCDALRTAAAALEREAERLDAEALRTRAAATDAAFADGLAFLRRAAVTRPES